MAFLKEQGESSTDGRKNSFANGAMVMCLWRDNYYRFHLLLFY